MQIITDMRILKIMFGREFTPTNGRFLIFTPREIEQMEAADKGYLPPLRYQCLLCEKEFSSPVHQSDDGNVFCSRKCRQAYEAECGLTGDSYETQADLYACANLNHVSPDDY